MIFFTYYCSLSRSLSNQSVRIHQSKFAKTNPYCSFVFPPSHIEINVILIICVQVTNRHWVDNMWIIVDVIYGGTSKFILCKHHCRCDTIIYPLLIIIVDYTKYKHCFKLFSTILYKGNILLTIISSAAKNIQLQTV